jgi:hypothetical protein
MRVTTVNKSQRSDSTSTFAEAYPLLPHSNTERVDPKDSIPFNIRDILRQVVKKIHSDKTFTDFLPNSMRLTVNTCQVQEFQVIEYE